MKRYKVAINDTPTFNQVVGLTNTTFDSSNIVSGRAATEDQLVEINDAIPIFGSFSGAAENVEVPANGRKNVQFDVTLPEGHTIMAYKQISTSGTNFRNVFIQTFATSGGSTKANISLYNTGSTVATIKVSVTGLSMKTS